MPQNIPIVIGGPTASGKSQLAIDLAQAFDGVVINADASQVYKSIPIISAAPSAADREKAPHRLYGYLEDEASGNVVSWLTEAAAAVRQAWAENRTPIVVGGSGLYLDNLINGSTPIPEVDPDVRRRLLEIAAAEGVPDETGKNPGEGLFFEGGKLTATGRSAHASTPDEGDNALKKLFAMLSENSDEIKNIYEILFEDRYGLKKLCDETGSLTISPDIAEYEKGTLSVVCDIRYPATCKRSEVLGLIDKFGVKYELLHCQAPLYSNREGFLVSTLKEVWKEATGREDEPIAIGGGTYARALKNGAAFGPQFPGEESTIHCKDEYISLKNVEKLSEIYRLAIRKLTE